MSRDRIRIVRPLLGLAGAVLVALVALEPIGAAPVSAAAGSPLPSAVTRPALAAPARAEKPPVFAYYYIWFSHGSWDRAKTDLPQLGTYSSADPKVIAQHITWAREAGIDGFIVSWKHEARLDVPLQRLIAEAQRQQFKLILLYQGLDFQRDPIDPKRVLDDLSWFSRTYGTNPVFDVFGRPAVIWSGTWKFTPDAIGMVRAGLGAPDSLLLLGSERSAADYEARRDLFDGDAYYWSSADPTRTPGYQKRLDDLGAAVGADDGAKWIAPITPGFDARLIGGTSIVDRRGGETYRLAWAAAARSHPSAMGIISWNEFSENSHIEPSSANGPLYLELTRQLEGASGAGQFALPTASARPSADGNPVLGPVDSSDLSIDARGRQQILSLISGLALLIGLGLVIHRMRGRPSRSSH